MSREVFGQGARKKAGQVVDGPEGVGRDDRVLPRGVSPEHFAKVYEKTSEGVTALEGALRQTGDIVLRAKTRPSHRPSRASSLSICSLSM